MYVRPVFIESFVDEGHTFMIERSESAGVTPPRETLDSGLRKSWVVVWKLEEDMLI